MPPPSRRVERARHASPAATHALELLEWPAVLEALASRCASAAAARAARALSPTLGAGEVRCRLAECAEAAALLAEEAPPVAGVRDVRAPVGLASRGGSLEPAQLADVSRTLGALARLASYFRREAVAETAPALAEIAASVTEQEALRVAIDRSIDERGGVRDDATPELARLLRRRASLGARVEEELGNIRRDPDVAAALSDDFVTLRDGRFVLPVRSDRRHAVAGILHGRSGSGQSLYVEPQRVVDLNNDLRVVEIDVEEEVARLLAELTARVGAVADELVASLDAHAAIDLAVARARLMLALGATVPEVTVEGDLVLPELAHPLLVLLSGDAGGEGERREHGDVIRNNLEMPACSPGLLVTGPNTGGKTVIMKATGLACLMAAAGLPVAAGPGARVPLFGAVLADVGDEQSLARSLSSFSAHVANLLAILEAVDDVAPRPALVMLDELMSGTDPGEGGALARSLMEWLVAREARVIVTTHLGELKAFAAEHPRWRNAALEFDPATLSPTYRVRVGVPGASAALMVAERLGLPRAMLQRARELATDETLRAESLLAELEAARTEARRERAEADEQRRLAEAARAEAEERLGALRRRQSDELTAERRTVEEELRRVRAVAAGVTADLQRRPSLPQAADAIRRLDELRGELSELRLDADGSTSAGPPPRLEPGARVVSRRLRRAGEIIEGPDGRGRVRVRFGGLSVQVDASDLVAAQGAQGSATSPGPPSGGARAASTAGAARPRSRGSDASPGSDGPRRSEGSRRSSGSLAAALRRAAGVPAPRGRSAGEGGGAAGRDASDASPEEGSGVPFTPQGERNACDLRGLTVEEALSRVERFLADARRAGERQVVLIHGHGTGALRRAIRAHLPSELVVTAFRAGGHGEGGDGVTVASLA